MPAHSYTRINTHHRHTWLASLVDGGAGVERACAVHVLVAPLSAFEALHVAHLAAKRLVLCSLLALEIAVLG
jgi:hypothetical protein